MKNSLSQASALLELTRDAYEPPDAAARERVRQRIALAVAGTAATASASAAQAASANKLSAVAQGSGASSINLFAKLALVTSMTMMGGAVWLVFPHGAPAGRTQVTWMRMTEAPELRAPAPPVMRVEPLQERSAVEQRASAPSADAELSPTQAPTRSAVPIAEQARAEARADQPRAETRASQPYAEARADHTRAERARAEEHAEPTRAEQTAAEPAAEPSPAARSPLLRSHERRGRRAASLSEEESLAAEVSLLHNADKALSSGDPELALSMLQTHREEFPHALLREEQAGLVALARCTVDADDTRPARSFLARHPDALLNARIRAACALSAP